jgi:hypothetical protein
LDEDRDFTILGCISAKITDQNSSDQATILHCIKEVKPWPGILLDFQVLLDFQGQLRTCYYKAQESFGTPSLLNLRFAITHAKNTNAINVKYGYMGNTIYSKTLTSEFAAVEESLVLGAYRDASGAFGRFFKGTIKEFEIKDIAISDSAMDDYVQILNLRPVYNATNLNFDGATLIDTSVKPWTAENINKTLFVKIHLDEWTSVAVTGNTLLDASSVYTSSDDWKGFMYMVDIPSDAGIFRLPGTYMRTIGAGTIYIRRLGLDNAMSVGYTSDGTPPTQYFKINPIPADALSTVSDSSIILGGRRDNTWFYTGKIKSIDIYWLD